MPKRGPNPQTHQTGLGKNLKTLGTSAKKAKAATAITPITSDTGECIEGGEDNLRNIDIELLEKAKQAGLGWAGVSRAFLNAGKEKVWIGPGAAGGWSTSWTTIIEFLGAYRKLMIDHLITGYIEKLGSSDRARGVYSDFIGTAKFADVVRFSAQGSTNTTSDYDMTLSGPGAPCIVRHITRTFNSFTHETMSYAFDSNFYIGPDILTRRSHTQKYAERNIQLWFPDGEKAEHNVAVPVPDGDVLAREREYILKKLTPTHVEHKKDIIEQYNRLVEYGKKLDQFAYWNGDSALTKDEFFDLLFDMKLVSMEAYHGISTVLVVVYGMQGKTPKMGELRRVLSEGCFANACLENALDFTNHWNDYVSKAGDARDSGTADTDQMMFVKLSKYILRVLTCVEELQKKTSDNNKLAALASLARLRAQVDAVYKDRASGKSSVAVSLSDYGIGADGRIAAIGKGTGLVHEAYNYLTGSQSQAFGFWPRLEPKDDRKMVKGEGSNPFPPPRFARGKIKDVARRSEA